MFELIGGCCVHALVAEVWATPKPGLVDRLDSGAHTDMDIRTFFYSAVAIAPYFAVLARAGYEEDCPDGELLARLRPVGLAAERAMLAATGGVNTHKGAIYSLGLVAAAAGRCLAKGIPPHAEETCNTIARIAGPDLWAYALGPGSGDASPCRRYGLLGARGEAAAGFSTVLENAMLELGGCGRFPGNSRMLQALLRLVAVAKDTNIVLRGSLEALVEVRRMARQCLKLGGAYTAEGMAYLGEMNRLLTENNLSPGGCADLLAVAVALHLLESRVASGEEFEFVAADRDAAAL